MGAGRQPRPRTRMSQRRVNPRSLTVAKQPNFFRTRTPLPHTGCCVGLRVLCDPRTNIDTLAKRLEVGEIRATNDRLPRDHPQKGRPIPLHVDFYRVGWCGLWLMANGKASPSDGSAVRLALLGAQSHQRHGGVSGSSLPISFRCTLSWSMRRPTAMDQRSLQRQPIDAH